MMMGLGTDYEIDSAGNTIDCDLWSNITNSACWGFPGSSTVPTGNVVTPSYGLSTTALVLGAAAVGGVVLILGLKG
jgi:hypothetical protein